jgi:hypothetical protein
MPVEKFWGKVRFYRDTVAPADNEAKALGELVISYATGLAEIFVDQIGRVIVEHQGNKGAANGYAGLGPDGKVPTAQLPAGGGGSGPDTLTPVGPITADQAVAWGDCVLVDTTASDVTITLPAATGSGSKLEIWKKVAAHQVLVVPDGSDTVNGSNPPPAILAAYEQPLYRDFGPGVVLSV